MKGLRVVHGFQKGNVGSRKGIKKKTPEKTSKGREEERGSGRNEFRGKRAIHRLKNKKRCIQKKLGGIDYNAKET